MTTDRHDPEATPGLQDEFWGEQTEWLPREPSAERSGPKIAIRRWWDALLGGGAVAARSHGGAGVSSPAADEPARLIERPPAAPHANADDVEADDDNTWTDDDEAWTVEPEPQRGRHPGVDPLLARLGGLAVIVTLAAPLVVGFTGSGTDAQSADALLTANSGAPSAEFADPTTTAGAEDPPVAATTESAAPAGSTPDTAPTEAPSAASVDDSNAEPEPSTTEGSTTSSSGAAALEAAPEAAQTPPVTTAPCGAEYELAAGDYWIRIADAAGVSLAELLDVNDSSVDTVLVPGRSICLPVGAAMPAPPTTIAPASAPRAPTAPTAPATTSAPSRPATTVAPAPTTTVAARPAAVPQSQAAAIIRDVWPDDLEERALEIAWRESNHQSNVNNWCCYGLFQIHWEAHRSWLSTLGVTSVSQLYDPVINATAAYTLYQRSGGFGPWGG
jgi:LysM repeat protein